jgi:hypothetical protein
MDGKLEDKAEIPYVIVRSHTAGVHAGFLKKRVGDTITLKDSIRLWQWSGASLSQVATTGPANGINKFGMPVFRTDIVSPQGFEILYCSEKAMKAIKAIEPWTV